MTKKIILLGYMGSGKSTVAKKLAAKTNLPFIDLDAYIEKKALLSVKKIFEQLGEIKFRKLEHEALVELIQSDQAMIISLGGGTPCYANNHELLKGEHVASFYLKASINTLFERLVINKKNRPLIADKTDEEMKEFIAMHLFERSFFYNQAQRAVSVDNKTADQVTEDILNILA